MNTRTQAAAKPAVKTSKLNGAIPHVEAKPHAADSSSFEKAYARYQQAQSDMLGFFATPGWKRVVVAFVTSLVVGYGIGYLGGTILNWMVAGAMLASAPLFLSITIWVLGAIATIYAAAKVGSRIGGAILTGEADERAIAAYDATRAALVKLNPMRLFNRAPVASTVH